MAAFDELQPASFDGIKYAITHVNVKGGLRDHVHEFPHAQGGKPERMGRKLYTIEMECIFSTETVRDYPDAWPGDLSDLRDRFEQGVVSDLVIPTIGAIKAYAIDWSQDWMARNRSGETARFVFREEGDEELLIDSVVSIQYQALSSKLDVLVTEADALGIVDAFDSVVSLVNDIATIQDQVELQGELLAAKVDMLIGACDTLDGTIRELQDPLAFRCVEALQDLAVAAIRINEDLLQKLAPTFLFTVPFGMSVVDVARAMYGDTSRAVELLKLNAINDAFAIEPGTVLRGYIANLNAA